MGLVYRILVVLKVFFALVLSETVNILRNLQKTKCIYIFCGGGGREEEFIACLCP